MLSSGSAALIVGATFSALATVAHVACVVIGPRAYRFMGAGERMARAAEAGHNQPAAVTLALAVVLFLWYVYALAGAGLIPLLPFTKIALGVITAVYLVRAVSFPLLRPAFPENSTTFWWVSAGICLVIGLLHRYGLLSRWATLA